MSAWDSDFVDQVEDDGVLGPADTLESDDLLDDPLDTGIIPADHWSAGQGFGTTVAEERIGESLDQHLRQEEPESDTVNGSWIEPDPRSGRLVAADEGAHAQTEPQTYARDVGIDGGAASAEEAAVHVISTDRQP